MKRNSRRSSSPKHYHAIAIDYDGTLTEGEQPSAATLDAIAAIRETGTRMVLVTGRVLADLEHVFPTVDDYFDAVVAENGGVLRHRGVSRALAAPVPFELDERLVHRGVAFARGQVLLACQAEHELAVLAELRELGSDCQLIRNRGALMVLPAGVTKGTGVVEVLRVLGVSHHSAIAIGDAENDLALLDRCELRVAVSNAVDSLRRNADLVLEKPNGEGVSDFLQGPLARGQAHPFPGRWRLALGTSRTGEVVSLPSSHINVLVIGDSGAGKSYMAGLLAERLLELDYSLCVIDPEGDHAPLGRVRGVVTVGGRHALPSAADMPDLLRRDLGSLVFDLSLTSPDRSTPYLDEVFGALKQERIETGLPHWIVVDEAHVPFGAGSVACKSFSSEDTGLCLVTYRPERLCTDNPLRFDYVIALSNGNGLSSETVRTLDRFAGALDLDALPSPERGEGLLVALGTEVHASVFKLGARGVMHVRHWHKYAESRLPPEKLFLFRTVHGPTGAKAHNLFAFRRELLSCDPEVVWHHLANGDFSRWMESVLRDEELANMARETEQSLVGPGSLEGARRQLIEAIEDRYLA